MWAVLVIVFCAYLEVFRAYLEVFQAYLEVFFPIFLNSFRDPPLERRWTEESGSLNAAKLCLNMFQNIVAYHNIEYIVSNQMSQLQCHNVINVLAMIFCGHLKTYQIMSKPIQTTQDFSGKIKSVFVPLT